MEATAVSWTSEAEPGLGSWLIQPPHKSIQLRSSGLRIRCWIVLARFLGRSGIANRDCHQLSPVRNQYGSPL